MLGTKKAPSAGALCARSVASADLHQHSPLRLTQYTSSPCGDYLRVLVLPCPLNYTEVTSAPQPVQSRMVGGLGSAHKKGTLNGCLMRKVRSFDQDPPVYPATAHPVYLIASQQLRQGSCFTLHSSSYLSSRYTTSSWVTHTVMRRHGEGCTPYRWYAPNTLDYEAIACASTWARRALLPVS